MNHGMSASGWVMLFTLSLLWGMAFLFMELAIPSFAPFTLVLLRVGLATVIAGWMLKRRGVAPIALLCQRWRSYAFIGFFGSAFPFVCFAWGQRYIDSGMAGVLNTLTPLCVYLLALFYGMEKFHPARIAGIGLGVIGVVILLSPERETAAFWGIIAGLAAALSYAVSALFAGKRIANLSPVENTFGQLSFAALIVLPMALWERPWQVEILPSALAAVIALGVLSTLAAWLLYYRLLASVGAVNTVLAVLLVPLTAVVLGVVILNEPLDRSLIFGSGLIITGLFFTDARFRRLLTAWVRPAK